MSSVGCSALPSSGDTRVSGNADAVISATRRASTRPSPVSTLRSLTRAAPSSATVLRDRRQIAKSWSTLGSTRDAGRVVRLQAHDPAAFVEGQPFVEQFTGQFDADDPDRDGGRQ